MRRRSLMGGGDKPIEFVDAEVKRICVEQWGGKDGGVAAASDRVGNKKVRGKTGEITYKQAASIKVIQGQFQNNATIEYFDELQYFTSLERLGYAGAFAGNQGSFKNCTNLKHITLPNSLKYLSPGYNHNEGTFYNCSSLTDIYLPDSVIQSCEALFRGCTNLKTIRWSSNLRHFPDNRYNSYMFQNCTSLESITNLSIPQTIGNITLSDTAGQEFENCRKLNLDFVDFSNLVSISGTSFRGCYQLPEHLILSKVTHLEPYFFRDTPIRRLYLPIFSSIADGEYTFEYCPAYLIDFGSNLSGTFRSYNYDMKTLVLRGDNYSNLSFNGNKIGRIYVDSSIINTFKTQFSSLENIVFSIGGPEWTNQFGSSDEWADYPKNRELYDSQVEYLQGDGSAYINTNIGFSEKTITTLSIAYSNINNTNIAWGAYWDDSPKKPDVQIGTNNTGKWIISGGSGISVSGATNNTAVTLNQKYTITIVYYAQQYSQNAFLFARNNDKGAYLYSNVKMYNPKIWSNDAIVRDYIPVRKDGVGYLFDKITGTLFGNANSEGAFIIGPDVED